MLDCVADFLEVGPAELNVHNAVESELFVDHAKRVIRPHVVVTVLSQLAVAAVHAAVHEVAVAEERGAHHRVLLDQGDYVGCVLFAQNEHHLQLRRSVESRVHPPGDRCRRHGAKLGVVDFGLVDFDWALELEVRQNVRLHVEVEASPVQSEEVARRFAECLRLLHDHLVGDVRPRLHDPQRQRRIQVVDVDAVADGRTRRRNLEKAK